MIFFYFIRQECLESNHKVQINEKDAFDTLKGEITSTGTFCK